MANVNRLITLTTKGNNSGPLYDIYYSNDCINYTICSNGSSVNLPAVGSSAIVTMPDTAICIKLVNLTPGCYLNEVIQYLNCECVETVTLNVTNAGSITYRNCFGIAQVVNVSTGLQTIGSFGEGCVNLTTLGGSAIYSIDALGICCVPVSTTTTTTSTTTTSTSTTTTTTTQGPTTTTTTFSNNPCICTEVSITSEGGEVATFNCYGQNENYVYMTAGTRYICAAEIGGLLQVSIVSGTGTYSPVGNCKTQPCPPTPPPTTTTTTQPPTTTTTTSTTTTTTTVAPTTTTTTTPPACVTQVTFEVDSAGTVGYINCCGTPVSNFYGIGPQVINDCIQTGTLSGIGATISQITYGNTACNCITTTTTTSTTTSTTTTTTAAPVNVVVNSVFSLDVDINSVQIDGINVTYVTGDNFPIDGGAGSGTFQTTLTGTRDIVIQYGSSISGQNITVTDSNSNVTCHNVPGNGAGTFTVIGASINSSGDVFIFASDGLCS